MLLEPGDEAVLLSPYYFNHQMSVTLLGAGSRVVETRAQKGYLPKSSGPWTLGHQEPGSWSSSIGSLPGLGDRVVTVGSFSNSLALAGWRLGFLCAPAAFVDEAVKIRDGSVICATHAAQWAPARTLDHAAEGRRYFAEKRKVLAGRRDALRAPLLKDERIAVHIPGGACFCIRQPARGRGW